MSAPTNPHLSTIAGLLGVSVDALSAPRAPHTLHASGNGDRWLLVSGPDGALSVRHVGNPASGGHVTEYELGAFLDRDRESPQCDALRRLIDVAVVAYLGL